MAILVLDKTLTGLLAVVKAVAAILETTTIGLVAAIEIKTRIKVLEVKTIGLTAIEEIKSMARDPETTKIGLAAITETKTGIKVLETTLTPTVEILGTEIGKITRTSTEWTETMMSSPTVEVWATTRDQATTTEWAHLARADGVPMTMTLMVWAQAEEATVESKLTDQAPAE